jgi:hypothetical protein
MARESAMNRPHAWSFGWACIDAAVCYSVGLALLFSGLLHLSNPYMFLASILQYGLTNTATSQTLSLLLPSFQITAAVALLSGVWRTAAIVSSFALFSLFSVAQWFAIVNNLPISCGCFGSLSHAITPVSASAVTATACVLGISTFLSVRKRKRSHMSGK